MGGEEGEGENERRESRDRRDDWNLPWSVSRSSRVNVKDREDGYSEKERL